VSDGSLSGPKLKLERAKQHIEDLEAAIERFFETNPYELFIENNSETGQREHKVRRVDAPPDSLALIAGDVIHNFRSALDHLIWQLVIANGKKPDDLRTEFPVWGKKAGFEKGRPGRAKGISEQALDVLYGLKPYKGGNDALWLLHRLDIVDKHRLLLAVISSAQGIVVDLVAPLERLLGKPPDEVSGSRKLAIKAAEPTLLVPGATVFTQSPGSEEHHDTEITVAIALGEPEVPLGDSVVVTLNQLSSFVREVIDLFTPLLG
jgi:hypothetical protein